MSNERKDTVKLKQELADALGVQGKSYWGKLSLFLAGRCTKSQLDSVAQIALTTHHEVKLHNRLISSILYNCQMDVPEPVGDGSTDYVVKTTYGKRKFKNDLHPQEIKKRFITRAIYSLSKEDRVRIMALGEKPLNNIPLEKTEEPFNGLLLSDIDSVPISFRDAGDLPTFETLRQRIKFIGAMNGCDGGGDDVVDLMSKGLNVLQIITQIYMKNMVDATRFKVEHLSELPIPGPVNGNNSYSSPAHALTSYSSPANALTSHSSPANKNGIFQSQISAKGTITSQSSPAYKIKPLPPSHSNLQNSRYRQSSEPVLSARKWEAKQSVKNEREIGIQDIEFNFRISPNLNANLAERMRFESELERLAVDDL